MQDMGEDPDRMFEEALVADNYCLAATGSKEDGINEGNSNEGNSNEGDGGEGDGAGGMGPGSAATPTLAIHICRGNNESKWYAEGGYDSIGEKLFNTLNVDRFLLEYDTDRAGTFEPLRLVPRGKMVVRGLVSSKEPVMESREQLLARLDEASCYVPEEYLALSPQCGFASAAAGNLLTEEQQWRKLELVAETTRQRWGR